LQGGSDISSGASTLLPVVSENEDQAEELDRKLSQGAKPANGAGENTMDSELSNKMSKAIVKSVCGKILTRDEKSNFSKLTFLSSRRILLF